MVGRTAPPRTPETAWRYVPTEPREVAVHRQRMTDSNHSGTITTYSDTVIHRRRSHSQSPKLTEQNITTAEGVDGSALFSGAKIFFSTRQSLNTSLVFYYASRCLDNRAMVLSSRSIRLASRSSTCWFHPSLLRVMMSRVSFASNSAFRAPRWCSIISGRSRSTNISTASSVRGRSASASVTSPAGSAVVVFTIE